MTGDHDGGTGPLTGVNVLDLSRWIAGPSCAMLLGDLGADVVKVEPLRGEESRHVGPRVAGQSAYTLTYNRNKRGMTLDTRHPSSRTVLERLCEWADVLVENYRPGTMDAMGLDPATLASWNPDLIHVSISGYGGRGSSADQPLFNAIAEAESGVMQLTGDPEVGPVMSGNFSADHTAGLYAAFSVTAALAGRERGRPTRRVDVSLFHSMLSLSSFPYTAALNGIASQRPVVNRDKLAAPGNAFRASDGRFVYIDAGTDRLYDALLDAMGNPPSLSATAGIGGDGRNEHVDLIEQEIASWVAGLSTEQVIGRLSDAGVPHGLVRSIDEVASEPELRYDAAVHLVDVGGGEQALVPGNELAFDGTLPAIHRHPPRIGEHTREVLATVCGFDDETVDKLLAEEVCR